ncbi:winged helix-turn-helix domain-containing tetratricopeptide repeat protein (plasmid) [Skermanella rosea]|uniref:winged helix-turn-helix domain-containing tetratricopeptide repeat protein n=1 Tax=Skermanella rosea TaxID=1817965 RepID=UPI001933FC1D|nr:winged helix-turn-helix domain-containing tetratricopeptide repeat protein [Skermanella rosea]UEM07874.1 winged helix-turn-helix domain-containing tetratricopeptide repeat protein [Skermanella rosea]
MQFVFGDYLLDLDRRELSRGADAIAIGPQVFDLLVYLVRNRERVVSKDGLLDAVWGGRIVSESTLTSHINAVRKAIGDNGEEQRLIRTVARKGFRFVGDVREMRSSDGFGASRTGTLTSDEPPAHALALPDKPSIATLPFLNLSGDREQEYFADGIVEDIISALSRIGWLFVISRNSSFTYKGRSVDVKQVGRELGVRYVLEGSVRKAAHRVRITGQLIDATTGAHLWAERFESALDDIFELQDQVAESVVGAIAPQLERAEIDRAKRKPTESLDAYDYYLRGMANFHQRTREAVTLALPLFHKATELDRDFASAYGMAAWCHFWRKINGWMTDPADEAAEGAQLARRAVELGVNDAVALTRGGHALGHFGGDLDGCIALLDRALVLNPNLSAAWYLGGFQRISRGEHDDAIGRIARAMRLSPLDPEMVRMQAGTAMAHLFAGRFDAASSWAEKAFRDLPGFLLVAGIIAASHALAGRTDEARQALRHLRGLDPELRISNLKDWVLLRRPEDLAVFTEGLRKAGLPE